MGIVHYDPAVVWPGILDAIANGASLSAALMTLTPAPSYSWAKLQIRQSPDLARLYHQAVEDRGDRLAEEIIELADTPIPPGLSGRDASAWVQLLRVRIDTRRWAASKLRPRVYGDRLDLTVDQPRISVLEALRMAEQRVDGGYARFEQDTDAPRAYLGNQSG